MASFPTLPTTFQPSPTVTTPTNSITSTFTNGLANVIPDIFKAIPWVRIGEILLGMLLLNVGLAQLAGAPKIAKTIAKAVA